MVRAPDNFIVDGVISPYSLEIGALFVFFLLISKLNQMIYEKRIVNTLFCLF